MPKGPIEERTVRDADWVGWNRMERLVQQAKSAEFSAHEGYKRQMAPGLILVGFKTGGRISEVLPLTRDKISFEGEFWTVTLPLVKKYRKTKTVQKWKCDKCDRRWTEKPITIIHGSAEDWKLKCREGGEHEIVEYDGYESRKIERERRIEFHEDEPLNDEFRDYVQARRDLLFPHHKDETRPMKRAYAYQIITGVDPDIWPHWLRAQRACQLADELDFELEERQDWFEWEDDEYPRLYGSRKYEMRDKWREPKRRIN